jgi:hypothetical protein
MKCTRSEWNVAPPYGQTDKRTNKQTKILPGECPHNRTRLKTSNSFLTNHPGTLTFLEPRRNVRIRSLILYILVLNICKINILYKTITASLVRSSQRARYVRMYGREKSVSY